MREAVSVTRPGGGNPRRCFRPRGPCIKTQLPALVETGELHITSSRVDVGEDGGLGSRDTMSHLWPFISLALRAVPSTISNGSFPGRICPPPGRPRRLHHPSPDRRPLAPRPADPILVGGTFPEQEQPAVSRSTPDGVRNCGGECCPYWGRPPSGLRYAVPVGGSDAAAEGRGAAPPDLPAWPARDRGSRRRGHPLLGLAPRSWRISLAGPTPLSPSSYSVP